MKLKNFIIEVESATKRRTKDNYEHGCGDELSCREVGHSSRYPSIEAAFRDIVGDQTIKAEDIGTMDPNIYQDVRGQSQPRVVSNNQAAGLYRCVYDRMENSHGRKPNAQEEADFKEGKIDLILADYDVSFRIVSVGLEEEALAKFIGCRCDH